MTHEATLGSDHRPLVLQPHKLRVKKSFLFCFKAKWLQRNDCFTVISSTWNSEFQRSPMFILARKLTNCRKELSRWDKKVFKRNTKECQQLKEDIYVNPFDAYILHSHLGLIS